ncbi:MAG: HXXEE domain-containing protein, partial [Azorhizobium sp. 12-66-6]
MPLFATTWPWIGLGAAAMLILLLSVGDGLQADRRISRWQDLPWLTWAGVAAYMVHQFEEHGVDLFGQPYAFRGALCAMLGFRDAVSCPVPLEFITAVNVGGVWGAGLLSALLAPRWPLIGLSFFAVPLVNVLAHVGPAVVQQRYNPGLFTALVLFLPLCLWTLFIAARRYGVG